MPLFRNAQATSLALTMLSQWRRFDWCGFLVSRMLRRSRGWSRSLSRKDGESKMTPRRLFDWERGKAHEQGLEMSVYAETKNRVILDNDDSGMPQECNVSRQMWRCVVVED